ncbi:hypothetical protein ABIF97_004168 [Bradyrhizobium japonicum]
MAVAGSSTALTYAIIGDYFPTELVARANGALNVLQFGWAFVVQYGTELILKQWPLDAGHYPLVAYQVACGVNVLLQLTALIWFAIPWLPGLKGKAGDLVIGPGAGGWSPVEAIVPAGELVILDADEGGEW